MKCATCGAPLPEGAMFCGTCGRAVGHSPIPKSRVEDPRPSDTTILPPALLPTAPTPIMASEDPGGAERPMVTIDLIRRPAEAASRADLGPALSRTRGRLREPEPDAVGNADSEAVAGAGGSDDTEPGLAAPVPFVLSFSTGERVVVVGTGLLGRRPFAQPRERFEQLVSIADHERSVSKTHLEFGVEAGELWICDRYSANGTVIIPPSGVPHRCDPGRRFRVPRGGRVEIGDHWFDVR